MVLLYEGEDALQERALLVGVIVEERCIEMRIWSVRFGRSTGEGVDRGGTIVDCQRRLAASGLDIRWILGLFWCRLEKARDARRYDARMEA